jgi:hypothetical protein
VLSLPLLRIVWRPEQGWQAVLAFHPDWLHSLLSQAVPLSLLPAVAWPLGHALDPIGPQVVSVASLAASCLATFGLCVATVLLAAAAIYVLAPFFEVQRQWDGAMAVAAHSATPLLLASPLLVSATLTILVVVALFHSCLLCTLGLQRLLRCRRDDAPMFVAAVAMAVVLSGLVLGGLASSTGLL